MEHHTHLGVFNTGSQPVSVLLSREQRFEHLAILGSTGVGKSTLLRNIAAQDIARGDGLLYITPHGKDAEGLIDLVPAWRHNHVCYLCPADLEWPVAINFLEDTYPDQRALIADALVEALRDIWDSWGPKMESILRHSALAIVEVPNASFALIPRLITDDAFRLSFMRKVRNRHPRQFFLNRFEEWRDANKSEAVEPVLNKLDAILSFPHIENILGQSRSTLHFEHAMRAGRIVIVNLGGIGDTAAHLMGALLLARAYTAIMGRDRIDPSEHRDFHIIVDEVQRFATNSIGKLLREARKYRASFSFATQILASLPDETRAAVLGTTGSIAAFRMGPEDAAVIAPKFNRLHQDFNENALHGLSIGEAMVKIGGDDARNVQCPAPPAGLGSATIVKRQSRRHYGLPRAQVEERLRRALGEA